MALIALNIPNGQYRNGTEYQSMNRWRDANLVRWHDNALRPIGGWRQRGTVNISGTARGMLSWEDNSGVRRIALGTYNKLYFLSSVNALTDISPSDLAAGRVDATSFTGYGSGPYGDYLYGVERQDTGNVLRATTWSLEPWGEYLLATSSDDGRILEWQLNTSNDAAAVTNAPINNTGMMVTEERFVFAFGAGGDPRKIAWSDQEDNTTWTAAATNQAGDIQLQTNGTILAGLRTRGQALILTDQDAHTASYSGPPFVYGFERVGTSCGVIGAKAAASIDAGVIWMGLRNFFQYTGGAVRQIPCEVGDYVFSDINRDQQSKIHAIVNSEWNEIWWFYPSSGATECDRYVVYDYGDNIWATGTLDRTSGVDRGIFKNPLWIDDSGVLYEHEVGYSYSGTSPFAESGPIALGAGDNIMNVTEVIPDEKTQGDVNLKFKTRNYPNGTETEYGPFSTANPTSVRFNGRQVRMRVEGNASDDWRVGIMRLEAKAGGRR